MKEKPSPLFIVGYRRSGTTLLRNILQVHPDIAIVSESHFISYFYDNIELYGDLSVDDNLIKLITDIVSTRRYKARNVNTRVNHQLIEKISERTLSCILETLYEEYMERHRKIRWGDKTPFFLYRIPMVMDLFPTCKIIHIIRDPRAAIYSQMRAFKEYNVKKNALKWVEGMIEFEQAKKNMKSKQYLLVKYEDLVTNPRKVLSDICCFASLKYDDRLIAYHRNIKDDVQHAKSLLYNKPITARHVDIWKKEMAPDDISRIENIAGSLMVKYGYIRIGKTMKLDESHLESKIYAVQCYIKEIIDKHNFIVLLNKFIWKLLSKLGNACYRRNMVKSLGLNMLRLRIKFGSFDKPRKV